MNHQYLSWLHEVTTKGYEKGIMIPAELSSEVRKLFKAKVEPSKAVNAIIGIAHFKGIPINKE